MNWSGSHPPPFCAFLGWPSRGGGGCRPAGRWDRPHIVVATPGRMHKLLVEDNIPFVHQSLSLQLKFLVIDEVCVLWCWPSPPQMGPTLLAGAFCRDMAQIWDHHPRPDLTFSPISNPKPNPTSPYANPKPLPLTPASNLEYHHSAPPPILNLPISPGFYVLLSGSCGR